MDRLDRQILQALQLEGRAPFSRLAAVLGVSEQTIARRYRRLHTQGVVRVLGLIDPARQNQAAGSSAPNAAPTRPRTWPRSWPPAMTCPGSASPPAARK